MSEQKKGSNKPEAGENPSLKALRDRILSNPLKDSYKAWASSLPDEKELGDDVTIEL